MKQKHKNITKKISNKKNELTENSFLSFLTTHKYVFFLLLITLLLYVQTISFGFLNFDDDIYLNDNIYIKSLSLENLKYIFTNSYFANYHPFTLLSYAMEYHFWGLNTTIFHFNNVLFHLLNTYLVFVFIGFLSKEKTISFFVALLFAIHPMQVESVAWVSERKDVLYTFFYLLSVIKFTSFVKDEQNIKPLFYSLFFFICSLMSKSAAVSMPLVLVLIIWYFQKKWSYKIYLKTIPFFILSLVFGLIALETQKLSMGSNHGQHYVLIERIVLVFHNIYFYLIKFLLPINLSGLHPFPHLQDLGVPLWFYATPLLTFFLIILSFFIRKEDFKKVYIFSFLFFIFTIFTVLQIVFIGDSLASARYTYVPYIGLSFAVVYYIKMYYDSSRNKNVLAGILGVYFLFLLVQTHNHIKTWQNSETLWTNVIRVYPNYHDAYYNLAVFKQENGLTDEAINLYSKIVSKNRHAKAYHNRGNLYEFKGLLEQAINDYTESILIDTSFSVAYYNRGNAKKNKGDFEGAIYDFTKAIQINPVFVNSYNNRASVYFSMNKWELALEDYHAAIKIQEDFYLAYNNIGLIHYNRRNYEAAIEFLTLSLKYFPNNGETLFLRGLSKFESQQVQEACVDFKLASQNGNGEAMEYINRFCQ